MATITAERKPLKISPGYLAWLLLIGILITIGIISALQVFINGLEVTNMYDTVPWGLWITIALSAIALGAGAFTLSAIVYLFGLKKFTPIIRLAILVGFIGYTSALLTLVMDIGRPDRFWHPWVYWNVHSVLYRMMDYFANRTIQNLDEKKRSVTLLNLMTMKGGFDWAELTYPYSDPRNPMNQAFRSNDPVQFVLDRPMATQPGTA